METGIRAKKAAKIKVQILQETMKLLGKRSFKDLYVDHICDRVRISKVTFFKYFPQKEDILLYYYRYWSLEMAVILAKNKPEGLKAVRSIYEAMSASYEKHPGLILSLLSYLTSLSRPPAPFPMKPLERELLFENVEDINTYELLSLPQLFEKYLLDAVFKNQVKGVSDTKELAHIFLTSMYGSLITAHLRQVDSLPILMNRNFDILVKGLNS